jgi:hypothetical protein
MTIEQQGVVDFISMSKDKKIVTLTISDHLTWTEELEHMFLLQEKINKYLAFIESGEIYTAYKKAKGKKIEIEIYAKYDLTEKAKQFIDEIRNVLENAGYLFEWRYSPLKDNGHRDGGNDHF